MEIFRVGKRNPIQKASYINMRYKEYLKSTFRFGNDQLQELFEEQLKQEELYKGPYVDLNLPFKRGKSLNDLMDEGIVCKSFRRLGDMNFKDPYIPIRKNPSGKSEAAAEPLLRPVQAREKQNASCIRF